MVLKVICLVYLRIFPSLPRMLQQGRETTELYYLPASSTSEFEVTPFIDRTYSDNFSIYPANDVVDSRISRDK